GDIADEEDEHNREVYGGRFEQRVRLAAERNDGGDRTRSGECRQAERDDADIIAMGAFALLLLGSLHARPSRLEHVPADGEEQDAAGNLERLPCDAEELEDIGARDGEHDQNTEAGQDRTSKRSPPLVFRVRRGECHVERYCTERVDDGEQGRKREDRELEIHVRAPAMHSISTRAPSGRPFTPMAERAGGATPKKRPYTSFIAS